MSSAVASGAQNLPKMRCSNAERLGRHIRHPLTPKRSGSRQRRIASMAFHGPPNPFSFKEQEITILASNYGVCCTRLSLQVKDWARQQ